MIEALTEIIEDMRDIGVNNVLKESGDKPKELRSSKKRKPKEGYAVLIEMALPKKKMSKSDEEVTKSILGD